MNDIRYAGRSLARTPGFSAVAIVTLGLGIGASTAVFSIVDGALLRPLPYREPERLVNVLDASVREKELAKIFASYRDFEEYARDAKSIERIGAATWAARPSAVMTGRGHAKNYLTIPVTADFFATLGVRAERGRTFAREDLGNGCAVVVSDKFWKNALGADSAVVGQTLTLDDRACVVRGVMPAGFAFYPPTTQIWTLLQPDDPRLKRYFGVFMVARLKTGATAEQAEAELTALHAALHANDAVEKDLRAAVSGLQDQFTWLAGRTLRTTLAVLFAAVLMLLGIGCLNVANLLLGRSFARGREFAIRAALGAGRARIVRLLLAESAALASAGGALGVLVAWAAVRYFVHVEPIELPVGARISINGAALAFAAVTAAVTSALFGMAPVWQWRRTGIGGGLRVSSVGGGIGRQRLARLLIAAEAALSLTLLTAAGLLMRSMLSFETSPLGFSPEHVLVANASLPAKRYGDAAARARFGEALVQKLRAIPGVEAATLASTLPPYGLGLNTLDIEGKPAGEHPLHDVGQSFVSAGYFRTLGVALERGRAIEERDREGGEKVAVVNEALAREYFGGEDPIGRRVRMGEERDWLTVVGVAGNERRPQLFHEMSWSEQPALYRAIPQNAPEGFSVAVRGEGAGIGRAMEAAIVSLDSEAASGDVETMDARLASYLKYPRFRAAVLSAFSALALLLAAVGLYGVMAQFVAHRTREIGVRMAVGAARSDVLAWIAWYSGIPVACGMAAGLAMSLGLTRYLAGMLYGVGPGDMATFVAVAVVMMGAAALAMMLPARRAMGVDPAVALRDE